MCAVNHYRRKEEESKRMYLFGGREEKLATEFVYLVQRTMYGAIWLSAALVGATVVGAAAVGSVVICEEWCAVWCSS